MRQPRLLSLLRRRTLDRKPWLRVLVADAAPRRGSRSRLRRPVGHFVAH